MSVGNNASRDHVVSRGLFWCAAAILLAMAAGARFQYANQVGMWAWTDMDEYLFNAQHFPTLGQFPYYRFQPTAHFFHAIGVWLIGDTDYSVKYVNSSFDILC